MGFLQDFILHNRDNEIPPKFVVWAAYGAISAIIGRRVYVDLEHFVVVPNTYILLIAPAGGRKTSARDKAHEMVLQAAPTTIFSGDNDTYQGILTAMERDDAKVFYMDEKGNQLYYRPYCIFSPEFPDYIQNNPLGMIAFLTNIYDRRHYLYRLRNEDRKLDFPYVMMLACATPDWLADQVKAKQFAEGYGRRTILVCNEGYERKRPRLTQESRDAWDRCVSHLQRIQNIVGPMQLEAEAEKWYWDWYTSQPKVVEDVFVQCWRESWHINLLKVAMLISLSERSDRIVTIAYLQLALEQLKDVEAGFPMVTAKLGRSELTGPADLLMKVVRSNGGAIQEKVLKIKTMKNFKNTTEQWQVIEWLKQTDQLKAFPKDNKPWLALPECLLKLQNKPKE